MAMFEFRHIPDTFSVYHKYQIDEQHLSLHYLPPHKTKGPPHCAGAFVCPAIPDYPTASTPDWETGTQLQRPSASREA